ncbi:RTA1 domain protein [Penicillium diatomitis]|uniref:RTA1 domain protein n=1 Tax=Penicillium diatomitis TaxID=2819901 RepID=A0A9W9WKP7_9EURO|nr:RTA1 domain protein [Penicillium diatomitis]KAJ5469274.1 RTA1 domain protein [Penicillium diatomitis]
MIFASWDGFQGKLASKETVFMIFEGAMIAIACICLNIGHPGLWLGSPPKLRTGEVDTEFNTVHGRT